MFTGVIKLAQIDDYISPSQSCVQPKIMKPDKVEEKATVTLNDCLACSGCITSAESVLIEQMSVEKFLEMGQKQQKIFAIISTQTLLSLAKYYKMRVSECLQKLEKLLKRKLKNFEKIYDITLATQICHQLIFQEFEQRMANKKMPVLCSECPGWVCYSEKTLPSEVINYMSEVKSPQQILGQMIKKKYGFNTKVVSLMPCYDKKLQAIRFDLTGNQIQKEDKIKEVDLTLATIEVQQVIKKINPDQGLQIVQNQMQDQFQPQLAFVRDQSSNGYIEFILNRLRITEYQRTQVKNSDFVQYTFDLNGTKSKMAKCYGFRNIQKVVQLIKKNKCPYLYVEIMACPGGCFGGGGQIRYQGVKTKDIISQFEEELRKYRCVESGQKVNLEQYEIDKRNVIAKYKAVEKNLTMAAMNW